MSKRTIFFPLLTALFLTACTLTCDPGSLAQPDLVSPNWREVVDGTNAVLEWSYPDTCNPENFEIILSKDRDYSVIDSLYIKVGIIFGPDEELFAEEYFVRNNNFFVQQ